MGGDSEQFIDQSSFDHVFRERFKFYIGKTSTYTEAVEDPATCLIQAAQFHASYGLGHYLPRRPVVANIMALLANNQGISRPEQSTFHIPYKLTGDIRTNRLSIEIPTEITIQTDDVSNTSTILQIYYGLKDGDPETFRLTRQIPDEPIVFICELGAMIDHLKQNREKNPNPPFNRDGDLNKRFKYLSRLYGAKFHGTTMRTQQEEKTLNHLLDESFPGKRHLLTLLKPTIEITSVRAIFESLPYQIAIDMMNSFGLGKKEFPEILEYCNRTLMDFSDDFVTTQFMNLYPVTTRLVSIDTSDFY